MSLLRLWELGIRVRDGTSFLGAKAVLPSLVLKQQFELLKRQHHAHECSHVDGFDLHYPHNPHGDPHRHESAFTRSCQLEEVSTSSSRCDRLYPTTGSHNLQGAAITQGHAVVVDEERKIAAHAESCRAIGVSFVPLVVEKLGGWSKQAVDTLCIGRFVGQRLAIPPSESTRHLFQRVMLYTLWLRRHPP